MLGKEKEEIKQMKVASSEEGESHTSLSSQTDQVCTRESNGNSSSNGYYFQERAYIFIQNAEAGLVHYLA